MGHSSQRKGAAGERELADILCRHGYDVERGGSLSYGTVPDLVGLPGVHMVRDALKKIEHVPFGCEYCPLLKNFVSCPLTGTPFFAKPFRCEIDHEILPDCPIPFYLLGRVHGEDHGDDLRTLND